MNWFSSINPLYQLVLIPCAVVVAIVALWAVFQGIKWFVNIIKDFKALSKIDFDDEWMDIDKWIEAEDD